MLHVNEACVPHSGQSPRPPAAAAQRGHPSAPDVGPKFPHSWSSLAPQFVQAMQVSEEMSPPPGAPAAGTAAVPGAGWRWVTRTARGPVRLLAAHLVAGVAERSGAPRGPELAGGSGLSDLGGGVFLTLSTSWASLSNGSVRAWSSLCVSPTWFTSTRSALSRAPGGNWAEGRAGRGARMRGAASAGPPGSVRRCV